MTARCGDQLLFQIFASPVACGLREGGGFSSQVVSSNHRGLDNSNKLDELLDILFCFFYLYSNIS